MTPRRPERRAVRTLASLLFLSVLVGAFALPSVTPPAAAQTPKFGFYLAPPFVQTPYYAATVRTFNEPLVGASPNTVTTPQTWLGISTTNGVTGNWQRKESDVYGGATTNAPTATGDPQLADPTGTRSNYASAGVIDIELASPASCLGFWWSAGDRNNRVSVYTDGGQTLVGTITTTGLTDLLGTSGSPLIVNAIDGSAYNANSQYFGHPVTTGATATTVSPRSTPLEPFAYVHAIASGGVTFDRIVLSQGDPTNPSNFGFEFDNLAVATTCPLDPSLVVIDDDLIDPTFEQAFLASRTITAQPARPVLSCSPDPVAPEATVTCEVSDGPVDHEILWRAMLSETFASRGVLLDAAGRGTFTFVAPAGSAGRTIDVELVGWETATTVAVTSLVPTGVAAGAGPRIPAASLTGAVLALLIGTGIAARTTARARTGP